MTQKILAIDLGTHSLKALLLERRFEEFEILDFSEIVLNHQLRLGHEEQLALALEQLLGDAKWLTSDVVVTALPGHLMSSRVLEMPFASTKRIQDVLNFELENHIPVSVEDIFSDFHVLQQKDATTEVLAVYLPEAKVEKYMTVLVDKGFDPKYVGADVIDLATLAQVSMIPKEGFYVLLDIGHTKTNICIMEGTKLRYARTLGVAGFHFTRAIQRAYNLNYEKAESLKISRGRIYVREEESDQISRILTHVAIELITFIKQTVMAFQSQDGQIPISAFYCCGGSSQLIGLLDYLSFHLKSNVMELNALTMLQHNMNEPDELSLKLAPSLAIALRPLYSARIPKINFRKGNFAFKQDIQAVTSEFKSVLVFLVLILLASVGYYFYTDYHYSKRIVAIDLQVKKWVKGGELELDVATPTKRKEKGANASEVKKYLRGATGKLDELKKQVAEFTGGATATPLQVMHEISRLLPPKQSLNLQFAEFNFSDDFIKITAETDNPLNVPKVVTALEQSPYFSQVEADDAKAKPNNIWDFAIKIILKEQVIGTEKDKSTKAADTSEDV